MATDYQRKLAELESSAGVAADVRDAKKLLVRHSAWLTRYHGGLPVGVLASIMRTESGGAMDAPGDASIGEVGFYQITAAFPASVGVDPAARYDAETNVFLGSLEYQLAAAATVAHYPSLIVLGSEDNWKLARLAFAVGNSGARRLIDAAIARGFTRRGAVFAGVLKLVNSGGSFALSTSQPADKVWYRVNVVDNNFRVGQKVQLGFYGSPKRIPAPGDLAYRVPLSLQPFMDRSVIPRVGVDARVAVAGAAGLALVGLLVAGAYRRWAF